MKKIGILTFHASHNYGSMLQAYALQHYLEMQGHSVTIINLRPLAQKIMYENPSIFVNPTIRKFAKTLLFPKLYFENRKKWKIFEDFLHSNFHLSNKEYSNYREIEKDLNTYNFDVLISGGDQIWNQKCKDFEKSFFLPFACAGMKKVSYAPSLGNQSEAMSVPPYADLYIECLRDFDYISVREPDAAKMLSSLIDKKVEIMPDPALLLTSDFYKKMLGEPLIKGKYMFYYTPSHQGDKTAFEAAKKYVDKLGLSIVSSNKKAYQKGIVSHSGSGPIEFLNLLYYADFVCGRSFHLVVFSLLFHKNFAAINGDRDYRMNYILNKFKIEGRCISESNPDFDKMKEIDYDCVDQTIFELREQASSYFSKFLN